VTPKSTRAPQIGDAVEQVDALADLVAERLLIRVAEAMRAGADRLDSERARDERGATPLPDDTIVDQTSVRAPRELYLRLAREGAFPCVKDGKRVYAFWGEVREALARRMSLRTRPSVRKAEKRIDDDLDEVRRLMGVRAAGRS